MTSRTNPTATIVLRAGLLGLWAWAAAQGYLRAMDDALAAWLAGVRTPALDAVARALTFFGSSACSAAAVAGLAAVEWRRRGGRAAWRWGVALASGVAIEVVLRLAVAQWRPDTLALPSSMGWHERFELAGFPSGHAFRAAFLCGWAANLWPRARWGGVVLAVVVGATRPYLNRHWGSDVVGAWLVAWLVLALARPKQGAG